MPCRFEDHPTVPVTSVHSLVAIARNGWSRSIGTPGRNQLEQVVAITRCAQLTAPALRTLLLAAAIGSIMLVIGLGFAVRMATQIARAETLHALLIDELNHRVKNTLATVQSLAAQTFRGSADLEARRKFSARLASLGSTHDILSAQKWDNATIRAVVENVLEPFQGVAPRRIRIAGPELPLSSRCVVMLSMALHELATNAAKYGALSTADGRVFVAWDLARIIHPIDSPVAQTCVLA